MIRRCIIRLLTNNILKHILVKWNLSEETAQIDGLGRAGSSVPTNGIWLVLRTALMAARPVGGRFFSLPLVGHFLMR